MARIINKNLLQYQAIINRLNKDNIYLVYFSYDFSFKNLYHNPLLITTKALNFFTKSPSIDHVAHISHFEQDEITGDWQAKVFEANMQRGMEESYLYDKIRSIDGTVYLCDLGLKVDKEKAKAFTKKYYNLPYSKLKAALSGIDIFNKKVCSVKNDSGFCSWLTAKFLIDQGIGITLENGCLEEITPTDLFEMKNLGTKSIIYTA